MKLKAIIFLMIILTFNLLSVDPKQDEGTTIAPKVFLDLKDRGVDVNYLKTEITFVNYVRDRQNADIHMLITRSRTGTGGNEYNIKFLGLKANKGKDSELLLRP